MQKLLSFIKKYWIFIVLSILATITFFLQSSLNQSQTKPLPSPSPTTSTITYKNIQPGITPYTQLNQNLGAPTKTTQKATTSISEFPSDYPSEPHIAVNKNDINVLFVEKTSIQTPQNISQYIKKFGITTNIKYLNHLGPSYSFNLYLDQGLAFGAHTNTGDIVEIWYFQPGSIEDLEQISPFKILSSPPQYDSL